VPLAVTDEVTTLALVNLLNAGGSMKSCMSFLMPLVFSQIGINSAQAQEQGKLNTSSEF